MFLKCDSALCDVTHNDSKETEFYSELLIDANYKEGYYQVLLTLMQWTSEINDFRTDPLKSLKEKGRNVNFKEDNAEKLKFTTVYVLGWPVVFLETTQSIKKGEELTIDYGLEGKISVHLRLLGSHGENNLR